MKAKFLAAVLILSGLFVITNKSHACPNEPPNQNPVAILTAEPNSVVRLDSVILDGSGSYDTDGYIVRCDWDFENDGTYDYNETPGDKKAEHTYGSAGTYTAKLRVRDDDGATDTGTCTVYVSGVTFYVDPSGDDDNNGLSWDTAFATVQRGIDEAEDSDIVEVNEGTYYETIDFNGVTCTLTSTDPNNWDVTAKTIIDANAPNDVVITLEDVDSIIRGFTVTGGDLGIYCEGSSPTISNCVIKGNGSGDGLGGGMYDSNSSPIITNCFFIENDANCGSGMYDVNSRPTIINCVFSKNLASADGGAMYNHGSHPRIANCTFSKNDANDYGGGIYNYDSAPIMTNCIIWGNLAEFGSSIYNDNYDYDPNDDPNLVGCWKLDDGSGTTAIDSSGNGHNGSLNGDPNWRNGIINGALGFDGSDDYVLINNAPDLDGMDAITLTAWIKTGATGQWPSVINKYLHYGGCLDSSYTLRITETGAVVFQYNPGDAYVIKVSTITLADNSWHHIAGVYTGSQGSIYIDGDEVPLSRDDSDPGGALNSVDEDLLIGCGNHRDGYLYQFFDGSIDEVYIYNRALSEGEILALSGSIHYCDIKGCGGSGGNWDPNFGTDGGGNIDSDPCFVDADDPNGLDGILGTFDDGLRLTANSPCIDAADGDEAPSADILGVERFDINEVNNTGTGEPDYVDIGAYEVVGRVYNSTKDLYYLTIQAAIDDANDGDTIEVGKDTYYEDIDFKGKAITLTSIDPNDPNIVSATIIDGNDAVYHVVTFETSEEADSVLRGFTITGGNANVKGGGIYCSGASPTITNCVITENSSNSCGAGMYCDGSAASPTVINCIFSGNEAQWHGGGIFTDYSSPAVINCTFSGNSAAKEGGGMYCWYSYYPVVINCIFSGNKAEFGGGIYTLKSTPTVINCTFSGNRAIWDGGGMYNYYASESPTTEMVTNCIFWDNSAGWYGNEIYNNSSNPIVTYCDVEGGYDGAGNIDIDPCFAEPNTPAGSWTADASYDSSTFQSTLTDTSASWSVNEFAGRFVNPDTSPQYLRFLIVSNDANTIKVWADVSSIAHNNDTYIIYDYHLSSDSLCIDAGAPWFVYSSEPSPDGNRVNIGTYGNTDEAATTTDVDGDGISDAWQQHYWPDYDPNVSDPNHGPTGNPDGDNFSNWVEYLFGYDPNVVTTEDMELTGGLVFSTSGFHQIDPAKGETATINYVLNMNADVDISFSNTDTAVTVRTISQAATAGQMSAVWDGTDDEGVIVERYFYDVNVDANDGTATWTSADGEYTDCGTPPSFQDSNYYQVDSNDYDPYENIPVVMKCLMNDWCKRTIDVGIPGLGSSYDRVYRVTDDRLLEPGWNTFYWYGHWDVEPNTGQIYQEAKTTEVYFDGWDSVNKGAVLVYYEELLANLRCNPYRILPLADEVTTITYDLACDANVTIDTYDPDGSYFGSLFEEQEAGPQEVTWYGTTKDPYDANSRYISTEGVYRIEIECNKTTETLEGSITAYK